MSSDAVRTEMLIGLGESYCLSLFSATTQVVRVELCHLGICEREVVDGDVVGEICTLGRLRRNGCIML